MVKRLQTLVKVLRFFFLPPARGKMALRQIWHAHRGAEFAKTKLANQEESPLAQKVENPLLKYFQEKKEGRGIWKWTHYFDVYQHFFNPFREKGVRLLEVGIYSGGSLEMWCDYFGPSAQIYGVDIEPACQAYANEQIQVHIGDQADPGFWQSFKEKVAPLDIIIDDGGHTTQQQIVTLESLLPHLRPGGIYIIEDIHGEDNLFAAYLYGLQQRLNAAHFLPGEEYKTKVQPFQQEIHSIHLYPYLAVIQKRTAPIYEFPSPRRGTQWEPFYEGV